MATKDIKVGNFYHVLVKVLHIDPINGEIATETANEFGTSLNMEPTYFARCEKEAFFPIITENGTKNTAPAPKYDPCRLFKKGDKVRVVEWNGRKPEAEDKLYTVQQNERPGSTMVDIGPNATGGSSFYTVCFLELVTPVEEMEPYKLIDSPNTYNIVRDSAMVMTIHKKSHPHAKAAAEAECARLNAEYRKEQS